MMRGGGERGSINVTKGQGSIFVVYTKDPGEAKKIIPDLIHPIACN